MFARTLFTASLLFILTAPGSADDPPPEVNLKGSIADEKLHRKAPGDLVVANQKAWKDLTTAWKLKDAPKVDFDKLLLVVVTTRGDKLKITTELEKNGNLKVDGISTRDGMPGFRYGIVSVPRVGVKKVNGLPLPSK